VYNNFWPDARYAYFGNKISFHFISISGVLCMYLPVTAAGYFVFGSTVDENILTSIYKVANGPALYVVQILIVCHLMFGYVIVINPISQEFEEALNIPHCRFYPIEMYIITVLTKRSPWSRALPTR
jgi:hypothetical protein